MRINYLVLFVFISLFGCKEEIILDSVNSSNLMVVDGSITTKAGPYKVKLSITSSVKNPTIIPLTGCTVTIQENSGISELLNESEPGIYYTSSSGLQGRIGFSYKITILTPYGKEYVSDFQEIKQPIEIDSVYADTITMDENYSRVLGYKFFVDTKRAELKENYFLWHLSETYKYKADFKVYAFSFGGDFYINDVDTITGLDSLQICWKTQNINNIYTGKTSNLSIPQIIHQPLHFVGADSKRLIDRYSLYMEQYTIDEETYNFWSKVEEQISQENILITKQPYNIKGNVKNVKNINDNALGYFTVASVTSKRIFVSRKPYFIFHYPMCYIDRNLDHTNVPVIIYYVMDDEGLGIVQPDCIDCRSEGGYLEKPDFWED
ncbi:MAG: DUF4249 domain-containing protein [Bacteroidales bacterium]|jgi:hypothetical protein|nr:DUF4249 domain-containing protein [Bacteroidales bacterium]